MTTLEILHSLQSEIHSAVFATLDDRGLPQTCVIDLMLADEGGLYFLTAKGKSFYERLMARPFVALSGMKGGDTLSTVAISLRGAVRNIGKERLAEIFVQNPYMAKIYPTEKNREALEVFQIFRAEGEYFDLSQLPPYRIEFLVWRRSCPCVRVPDPCRKVHQLHPVQRGLSHKLHHRYDPTCPGCRPLPPLRQLLPNLSNGSCGENIMSTAVRTNISFRD